MSESNPDLEAAAQEELRKIVQQLKEVERRLREVHQSLAAPPGMETADTETADVETAPDEEEDNDISTEIRSIVECVLTDSLGPAIRDLQAASLYGVRSGRKG